MGKLDRFNFNTYDYNILIIEDSPSVSGILDKEFTKLGFKTFTSDTLSKGRDILKNHNIHYIMLDINLPDGNGYELIKELENSHEKIFVLTTETDKQLKEIAYQKGVIDFIIKDKSFFHKIPQLGKSIEHLEKNRSKNILIIDDSFVIQEQLKEILENRNYNIKTFSDTTSLLDTIKELKVDLILFRCTYKRD